MVLFDRKKAFSTFDHEMLLTKVSSYGVGGREAEWFESYLTGRKHCCIFEE